jgi:hypothetical protein
VVATDNKKLARLAALEVVVEMLGHGVKIVEQELDPRVVDAAYKLWGWKPGDKKDGGDKK